MMCLNLFLAMKNYSFLKYDWWAESFTVTVTSFSTVSSFVLFPHWSWALLLWMSFNWRWWACDLFVIIGGIRRLYRCGIISGLYISMWSDFLFVCIESCVWKTLHVITKCLLHVWPEHFSSLPCTLELCAAVWETSALPTWSNLVKICIIHLTFVVLLF